MLFLPMYVVQCEWKAAREAERLVDAEQARVVRLLSSASQSRRPKQRSRKTAALKRLVGALGYT